MHFYRLSLQQALNRLEKQRSTHYNPTMVEKDVLERRHTIPEESCRDLGDAKEKKHTGGKNLSRCSLRNYIGMRGWQHASLRHPP